MPARNIDEVIVQYARQQRHTQGHRRSQSNLKKTGATSQRIRAGFYLAGAIEVTVMTEISGGTRKRTGIILVPMPGVTKR